MKVQAIFESGDHRIVLEPESAAERALLASVLRDDLVGVVTSKRVGYRSDGEPELVRITLQPAPPVPVAPEPMPS